ncbi:PglZ domain-containing protein [Candidatus Poribacteria bacterium]|nr:PglZ domain-containing protein [Candidatus Poribacteria bacterium]
MKDIKGRILWIDGTLKAFTSNPLLKSELKPYIRFLEYNNYDVSFSENPEEGIDLLREWNFHCLLLSNNDTDEIRDFLTQIRKLDRHIPILILSESANQELMEYVNLFNVSDVLIMPTNPRQLVTSLTLLLERNVILNEYIPQAYVEEFHQHNTFSTQEPQLSKVTSDTTQANEWQTWIDTYINLLEWDIRFEDIKKTDELEEIHAIEKREANLAFTNYIKESYSSWLEGDKSPTLSVDLLDKFVIPEIQIGKSVLFVIIDCLRMDHWLKIEPLLYNDFQVSRHYYFSILPTTTGYARNAIFSGLFPRDLSDRYPELYAEPEVGHTSINRYEKDLMLLQLERYGIALKPTPHYFKIFDERGEIQYLQWFSETKRITLAAVVVDFIDMLTHMYPDESVLQQLIPDEKAFRGVAQTWFKNSRLYNIIQLAADRGITVILTSDHGSVKCNNAAKVSSQHELSSGLRVKEGKNIIYNQDASFIIKEPEKYRLPSNDNDKNYILALEDYYFVYDRHSTNYNDVFQGSFQHGGISFEEMILPCIVLEPR